MRWTRGQPARIARIAVLAVPLIAAFALRSVEAFGTRDVIEWDETYYLSMAVTAADGRGLYPYVFGYGQMPIMGGLGYAAYAYALAVKLAGPSLFALRAVSLAASIAGLLCLWLLVRRWYGSGAAWMAVSVAAGLRLFDMSNSIRMDTLAFAWVAAGLLAVAVAFERREERRHHLLAGLVFGLGLQVHIDTAVTAGACGLLYLFAARSSFLWYVSGWAIGLVLFIVLNILPDPDAFYRTTVLIRVDATSWYSSGTSSLAGSFLDPRILLAKEIERYRILFRSLHALELLLPVAAVVAAVIRRTPADRIVLTLVAGVVIAAAIVLNNASPLYFIHVAPALIVPLGPLFSHGWRRAGRIPTTELRFSSLLAFAIVASALTAVNSSDILRRPRGTTPQENADERFAARARGVVDPRCEIAGDGRLYVRYFPDYPYFVSARPTEVSYAMLYHGADTETEYWTLKSPEAVVMPGTLSPALADYIRANGLSPAGEGIWITPGGCRRHGR